jgi:hypothetical protein
MTEETITVSEIAGLVGVTERAVQKWAIDQRWEFDPGSNGTRHYYRDMLPPEIQERIFRAEHGLDEVSIEAMIERSGLTVPAAKMKHPATATKVRMVCECLAVPWNAKGRDKRIREIAESHGYNRATAYRLMRRAQAGEPIEAESRNHGWSVPGLGITLRAWDEESGRIAVETILANRRNHVEKLALYENIKERINQTGLTGSTGLEIKSQERRVGTYSSFCGLVRRMESLSIYTMRSGG